MACALVLSVAFLSACEPNVDVELLTLTSIAPERIEPGGEVTLTGAGFAPGREAEITLRGTVQVPGEPPHDAELHTTGLATSPEHIIFSLSREQLADFGGRGTFMGEVEAAFTAQDGMGVVKGVLRETSVDFTFPTILRLADTIVRSERGEELLGAVGITLGEEFGVADGLPVGEVAEGSEAAGAGVSPGDRIVGVDGRTVHDISDVVVTNGRSAVVLALARQDVAGDIAVRLSVPSPLQQHDKPTRPETRFGRAIAIGITFCLFLIAGPRPRRVQVRTSRTSRSRREQLWAGLETGLGAVAFAAIAIAFHRLGTAVEVGVLLAALLAATLLSGVQAGALRGQSSWLDHLLACYMPALAVVVAVAFLSSGARLHDIVLQQGAAPWGWLALRNPLVFAAVALAIALALPSRADTTSPLWHRAAEQGRTLLIALLITATALGAWAPPAFIGDALIAKVAGFVLFGLKASALFALSKARPRSADVSVAERRWGMAALFAIPACLFWLTLDLHVGELVGPALCVGAVVVAIQTFVESRRGPTLDAQPFA